MSHELLHMFEHTESHRFLYGGKVIEELREWPAMFKVIEERSHRHTRSDKDGSPAENVCIGMDAGDLSRHGFTSPNGM